MAFKSIMGKYKENIFKKNGQAFFKFDGIHTQAHTQRKKS